MARKKKHPEHENHERWLISYADFITLLFAFFVVMFASSQADKAKAQKVSDSVTTALEKGAQASSQQYVPKGIEDPKGKGGSQKGKDDKDGEEQKQKEKEKAKSDTPKEAIAADLAPTMKALNNALSKEMKSGKVEMHMEVRGLVVSLQEGAFFGSGDDKIVPASYDSLKKIADTLGTLNNPVRLEGHTDSVPIHTDHFQSNWELSAARSIAMMNLLANKYTVPRDRMGIAGYADTMPVDSNKTVAGRARNRRVDIVVLNADAANQNKPVDPAKPEAAKPAAADAKKGEAPKPEAAKPVAEVKKTEAAKPEPPKAETKPSPLADKGKVAKK